MKPAGEYLRVKPGSRPLNMTQAALGKFQEKEYIGQWAIFATELRTVFGGEVVKPLTLDFQCAIYSIELCVVYCVAVIQALREVCSECTGPQE